MDKKTRRSHNTADTSWPIEENEDGEYEAHDYSLSVAMDIRAALHDLLDEQKKTNRILAEIFGWKE